MQVFELSEGTAPLLISMPHVGTALPESLCARFTARALQLPDTDWHLDQLYAMAAESGAYIIKPIYSRYLIDLNRSLDNTLLYPNENNTELCPLTCFDYVPIYQLPTGTTQGISEEEQQQRIRDYWLPYHNQLRKLLNAIKTRHGIAVLYEAHSIKSQVPRFFGGQLPDLNIGSNSGQSCSRSLIATVLNVLHNFPNYSHSVDGRFKGGYITRTYGEPKANIHSLQMEIAQRNYMEEEFPFLYNDNRAAKLQVALHDVIEAILVWADENNSYKNS